MGLITVVEWSVVVVFMLQTSGWWKTVNMKVMYRFFRFYDFTLRLLRRWRTDSTILPVLRFLLQEFYESDVPILRFYLKIAMKVMYRFFDSSDFTISPQECYESDIPILRFYLKIVMKVMYWFFDSSDFAIFGVTSSSSWRNALWWKVAQCTWVKCNVSW